LLLHAIVHPADIQDHDGGILLLGTMFGLHRCLTKLFADAAYLRGELADRRGRNESTSLMWRQKRDKNFVSSQKCP
jgi:hypothetical protein